MNFAITSSHLLAVSELGVTTSVMVKYSEGFAVTPPPYVSSQHMDNEAVSLGAVSDVGTDSFKRWN